MSKFVIEAFKNGPIAVTGPVTYINAAGEEQRLERKRVSLCRCGASENKPFCDGSHAKVGFTAEPYKVIPDLPQE